MIIKNEHDNFYCTYFPVYYYVHSLLLIKIIVYHICVCINIIKKNIKNYHVYGLFYHVFYYNLYHNANLFLDY